MKIKTKVNLFSAIAFCALTLILNNKAYSQTKVDCPKAATQLEINICLQKEYVAANKGLNDLYKKVLTKLDAQQKSTLIQSQRKWISFRDEYAKIYELIYKGGSTVAT